MTTKELSLRHQLTFLSFSEPSVSKTPLACMCLYRTLCRADMSHFMTYSTCRTTTRGNLSRATTFFWPVLSRNISVLNMFWQKLCTLTFSGSCASTSFLSRRSKKGRSTLCKRRMIRMVSSSFRSTLKCERRTLIRKSPQLFPTIPTTL